MAKRILVVDDSQSIREMISITLEKEGYKVVRAHDGFSALDALGEKTFDLILTDLHMPGMDGVELIRKVRQLESCMCIPILFLTTESQISYKEEARKVGATGWIIKPILPDKLLAAVSKVCQ